MHSSFFAKNIRRFSIAALTASALFAAPALALEKGAAAPAFDLSGIDGAVKLASFQGKLVYLDFWASWCGPCRQSFPWMNEMQAKYGAQGLQIIGINLDAKNADARAFLAATPARFAVAFDPNGAIPRSYGVKGMPSSFLISAEGKVIFEHVGFNDTDRTELERKIKLSLGASK